MPISTGEFSKRNAIFITLALTPFLVWFLFDVVMIVVGAILIAILLYVVAEPFRWIGLRRGLSLTLSGIVIFSIFGGALYLFGSGIGSELQEVLSRAEAGQKQVTTALEASDFGKMLLSHAKRSNIVPDVAGKILSVSAEFLAGVTVAIVTGAFFAAEPSLYREGLSHLFPARLRANANETIDYLAGALRLWLLGQLIEMLLVGVMVGLAVFLLGLPSPLALGTIAGVAQFVPYVGPIVAMVPSVLVAATLDFATVLWTVIAYLIIHQIDGYLIMPIIQRRMVFVPPALMLISIVTVSKLFGSFAIVFAAPITVVLYVIVTKLYVRDTLGEAVTVPGDANSEPTA